MLQIWDFTQNSVLRLVKKKKYRKNFKIKNNSNFSSLLAQSDMTVLVRVRWPTGEWPLPRETSAHVPDVMHVPRRESWCQWWHKSTKRQFVSIIQHFSRRQRDTGLSSGNKRVFTKSSETKRVLTRSRETKHFVAARDLSETTWRVDVTASWVKYWLRIGPLGTELDKLGTF